MDRLLNLRQLVDPAADRLLVEWGRWRRIPEGPEGYKSSTLFISGGISGEDSFDHMCEDADRRAAEISDAIISDMELLHRITLQHVYEAAVWSMRRMAIEEQLMQAGMIFLVEARKKGLTT